MQLFLKLRLSLEWIPFSQQNGYMLYQTTEKHALSQYNTPDAGNESGNESGTHKQKRTEKRKESKMCVHMLSPRYFHILGYKFNTSKRKKIIPLPQKMKLTN